MVFEMSQGKIWVILTFYYEVVMTLSKEQPYKMASIIFSKNYQHNMPLNYATSVHMNLYI